MECQVDLIQANVFELQLSLSSSNSLSRHLSQIDTIVTNPPFGTKHKGADVLFLETGIRILKRNAKGGVMYSLHKSSTRQHLLKILNSKSNVKATVVAELVYDLKQTCNKKWKKKKNQNSFSVVFFFDWFLVLCLYDIHLNDWYCRWYENFIALSFIKTKTSFKNYYYYFWLETVFFS